MNDHGLRYECPDCGEIAVKFLPTEEVFMYGEGDDLAELTAIIPVGNCRACGFTFTDQKASVIKNEAVCAHLGIMPPSEIVALRKELGLSRAALADITKIGEASIARWERGAGHQNLALDRLLHLLRFSGNLNKLRARNCLQNAKSAPKGEIAATIYQFPSLADNLSQKEDEARGFCLHVRAG